jgi:AcrR family transcriptional regulator
MAFSTSESDLPPAPPPAWQRRALERSMADVQARSVERLASFVQAARDLAAETGSSSFTVQQVVARSGQSLKSFYRYFDGKDALLLALIEEDCAVGALFLAEMVDRHTEPVDRVRAWVEGVFELMASGEESYVAVLVREHRRLVEARPEEVEGALRPLLQLLIDDLTLAMANGEMRPADPERDARTVFNLVLLYIHELVLAGRTADAVDEAAAYVWSFCWGGLST